MPDGDDQRKPPKTDDSLKLLGRGALIAGVVLIFFLRGYIFGSFPIIILVTALCFLAVFASSWRSLAFLVLAYSAGEFVCTLGPGSNPCEPLNGGRYLTVVVAAAGVGAVEVWYQIRKHLPRRSEPQ
jgi:hypothetical protein